MSEALARKFHESYERLAPAFGYDTRNETRTFDPHSANGRLMIAVCAEVVGCVEGLERERDKWRECAEERKQAWYEMQSAFERSRDEVNALERERDQWHKCATRLAEAVSDMQSGWFYIQEVYGRLSGVGWDRAAQGVEVALREFERLKGETK